MSLLNRVVVQIKSCKPRNLTTAAQPLHIDEDIKHSFRTFEDNPVNHTVEHLNRFYTIPKKHYDVLKPLRLPGIPGLFENQVKTFTECCILIRKPALEILDYLKRADYSKPVNKYLIYGDKGCGKAMTLLQILHYGYSTKKIIVYVPRAKYWYEHPVEVVVSPKSGLVDLPIHGAAWLINFKKLNASLLDGINTTETHEWSVTESTAKDTPLTEMIEFGIERIKYSCDVINALFKELKQASTWGKCQVLVAIGGFNAFFADQTHIKDVNKQIVPSQNVSLTHAFLNLTTSDWCNGQIVVTVEKDATKNRRDSYFPRYLLSEKGFEHFDPFLPILVENYTEDEFAVVLEYYKDRKWIRDMSLDSHKELKLITGKNPLKLMEYCNHL